MGIAVKELLTLEYFKDYHVIAGKSGLHKEIQGTTLLEAPDALRWAKGKELVLSSGYVLAQEPDCLEEAFKSGSMQGTSAMMIKRSEDSKSTAIIICKYRINPTKSRRSIRF